MALSEDSVLVGIILNLQEQCSLLQEQTVQLTPVQGRPPAATQISRVHVLRTKQMDLELDMRRRVREWRDQQEQVMRDTPASPRILRLDPNFAGEASPHTIPPATSIQPTPSLRVMMAHNKTRLTALLIAVASALLTFLLQRLGGSP